MFTAQQKVVTKQASRQKRGLAVVGMYARKSDRQAGQQTGKTGSPADWQ
jgi:hypothetical protein